MERRPTGRRWRPRPRATTQIIFDLFNEPYPEIADRYYKTEGWKCWLHGGSDCVGIAYPSPGYTLVNTVSATGAGRADVRQKRVNPIVKRSFLPGLRVS